MEPETRYAKSGALRIAYQVTGEGPDLVMVPGLTSHLEIQWRDPGYRRFVRSLSSFCRLVRYDKRGTGLSDPVDEPPGLDQRMADLKAVISAARCRRPVVLGYSDGGPVAIALAAAHRRSVRALILYGASPRRPPGWARRSDFVPFSEARLIVKGIRGARLVELEGSDHLPWVGDAASVLSPIADFVAEVSGREGRRAAAAPEARPRRPATGWEALTDAERRVADLVAGGLANGEPAQVIDQGQADLGDERRWFHGPAMVTAWGRRPAA